MKSDSSKEVDHDLQKVHPGEIHDLQPSPQGRGEERNECRVVCRFLLEFGLVVEEVEVLQVLKQPNEVYDLPTGSLGFGQGKISDGRQEVSKVQMNLWHEAGYIQVLYLEFLDIG